MPVPAALSETSMAAAPGAPWNACTGFCLSSVIPVSSKRGRSGKFWMSAARTRSSSITNWENMTTLWPLPTVSARDAAQSAAAASIDDFGDVLPELSILVSCNGRRPVLKQRAEEEVEAVGDALGAQTALAGFYSHGEIVQAAIGGDAELHN